jgi:hypothetical protein
MRLAGCDEEAEHILFFMFCILVRILRRGLGRRLRVFFLLSVPRRKLNI